VSVARWRRAALVLALAAACYANTLGNALVWDDRLVADSPGAQLERSGAYWRPLVMLSFRVDRTLGGGAAWPYHLTNLLAHATVGWLVGELAAALGAAPEVALASALLFVAHPLQTEAVSYASGRTDVLCAGFALGALLVWRRARRPFDAAALGTAALVAAALACKETAVLVPLVLLFPGAQPADPRPRPWATLAVAVAWVVLFTAGGAPELRLADLPSRLPAVAAVAWSYLGLLVWPSDLHLERFVAVTGWSPAAAIAMWSGLVVLLGAAAWAAGRVPGGAVLLGFAVATYLPVSGVVPIYPAVADRVLFAAEHLAYLPLCGLVPLLTGLAAWGLPVRIGVLATAVLLAAWVPVVAARNRDWRDEETLFRHTLRYDPPAARVWYDLGNLRLAAGDPVEAERLYREAVKRAPGDGAVRLNLGIALQRQGRHAEARAAYAEALRLDPSLAAAFGAPPPSQRKSTR
jgi:hypothetical protein